MGTVVFVCVDKALTQRLATPSVLQGMQPVHVKDADQLLALKTGGNTLEAIFIGPGYAEPIRLAQRVHSVQSETTILICRLPEEYDEARRALQFAPMLGDVSCTTTSDAFDFELQSAISRSGQRRRMRAAITALNVALAATPRKREIALRYFDRLIEAAPIGVVALNAEFRILDSNRKAADIFDSSKESLSGKFLLSLFSREEAAEVQTVLNSAITSNQELLLPVVSRISDRASQFLEIRAVRFEVDAGDFGVLCILQDITERKRAETALHQQWHTFDTALSNTPDFTYIFDLRGRFTYANRALLELWQIPLENVAGKNFFDLGYPPELAERLQRQVQEVIDTKEIVRDETPFTGPNGETRRYEYIFVPVFGSDGRIQGVSGSTRDVTVRIEAEEALRKSEERLTLSLQAGGGVGIWDWDILLDRVYCDSQFAKLFSIEPESGVSGLPISQFVARVHPDDRITVARTIQEAVNTGGNYVEEYRVIQQNGSVRWVHARGRCHMDREHHPVRFLGVILDITERKRAEDELACSNEELKRVNRELEEFAYVASHDIQEPLRMVNIYTQMILKSIGPQRGKLEQYASFVQQGVTRMEALIDDLLSFSRAVQADVLPIGTVDLSASLTAAVSVLKHVIEESASVITAESLPTVRGDAVQMAHVFQNLLSNALKYRRKDLALQVDIRARWDGSYWIISVEDNGIGFEPHYAERIFGLFKRLHKEEYPGTGLGLAICKRIVERYGGRIWADGSPGQGATFYFSCPPEPEH